MKKIILFTLLLLTMFTLSGCMYESGFDYLDEDGYGQNYGYQPILSKAYVGPYVWDGTEEGQHIIIVDEYDGYEVTKIGGYSGRGYPQPFTIDFSYLGDSNVDYSSTHYTIDKFNELEKDSSITIEIIPFYVEFGSNINEISNTDTQMIESYQDDDILIWYIVQYYFTVTDNDTFYSSEGKLYLNKDDSLVEDFLYYEED